MKFLAIRNIFSAESSHSLFFTLTDASKTRNYDNACVSSMILNILIIHFHRMVTSFMIRTFMSDQNFLWHFWALKVYFIAKKTWLYTSKSLTRPFHTFLLIILSLITVELFFFLRDLSKSFVYTKSWGCSVEVKFSFYLDDWYWRPRLKRLYILRFWNSLFN